MTEKDTIKFNRLIDTFDRNFTITRMYADYLENYPEIISEDMVRELTSGGDITKEEALVALLSEIFALDFGKEEDRLIIMNYLTPSVRLLDAQKYKNNPYYKNIKIENVKDGNWEIKWEEYKAYRGVIASDMIMEEDFTEIPPLGFFTENFPFPAVLEGGNEWMTLTPVDLDTCDFAIEKAHGKVVTFGLGLGYFAYMASEKEEVESVTVVELSKDVIRLFEKYLLPQMKNEHKIKVINSDAFEYAEKILPQENFDLAFVDTWRDASDGAPMYKRMKDLEELSPNTEFLYWIENFLKSRIRAEKFSKIYNEYEKNPKDFEKSYENIKEFLQTPT